MDSIALFIHCSYILIITACTRFFKYTLYGQNYWVTNTLHLQELLETMQ